MFKPRPDATPEQIEKARKHFEEEHKDTPPANNVRVSLPRAQRALQAGDHGPRLWPTRAIFICGHRPGHHLATCPQQIVASLATRAFSRPVTVAERQPYLKLYSDVRKRGGSFEEGIALALQGVLVSPDFLFRLEQDCRRRPDAAGRCSDYELATRLSYFLWASMPDAELRRLADDAPAAHARRSSRRRSRRMLRDPKSRGARRAVRRTVAADSARSNRSTPDADKFPDFEDYLRLSMRKETELFFATVIREDRSILDFLDAKYTFMNERLARHYGIAGVTGPEFRRVDLTGTPREGVLMQASVLTVSSYATRTSPVLRGKWMLENLLNAPPPPPPPDVPRLDESAVGTDDDAAPADGGAPGKDPTCASCHRRMDPLGFGLENFDAHRRMARRSTASSPIDADGRAARRPQVRRPRGARGRSCNAEPDAFTRALTSKLLTYALGRGLERADRATVRRISREVAADGYKFSALVHRDRAEPAVPDAAQGPRRHDHHRQAPAATHIPARASALARAADARRDDAGAGCRSGEARADAAGLHVRAERRDDGRVDAG